MIIAEIGSVHDGKLNLALKLIRKSISSGADAVKFQMHISEEETLRNAPSPSYFNKENRYDYFKRTSFNFNQWKKIKKYCESLGAEFLCSPFSEKAVDILQKLKVKKYKVPSGELTNLPLLRKLKSTKKHIILSTGMSNWKEIDVAVKIIGKNFSLLQCTSEYPCSHKRVGLNILSEMKKKYKCQIGFSDHTLGFAASFAAASIGATLIEKHFTLSRNMYGSDAKNSMEPDEFSFFSKTIKDIWEIKKFKVDKDNLSKLKNMKKIFEKSVILNRDMKKNEKIKLKDLSFKKPGDGIRAFEYKKILGKKLVSNKKKSYKLKFKDLK
ncbi:N-acetylneuraminate synthase family protein [Candidatus Pelagibacter sp.]|nr:N-acetylneuraminate synthase family protein [Candidatus Pelagibacter sp.]